MSVTPARGRKRAAPANELSIVPHKKPALSLYRQQILEEDEYTEALAKIIRRDFFPDLDAIERAQERQARKNALDSFADIDVEQGQWTLQRTVTRTPAFAGDTPLPARSSLHPAEQKAYDEGLSLTAFLSKYTSEDNSSFAEILQRNNDARRTKYAWAYEGEKSAAEREKRNREARQRLIECVQRAVEASETGHVALIEGVEPGRPGERLVLEHGRTSIVGDKQSISQAKQRVITGSTSQLMIEDVKRKEDEEFQARKEGTLALATVAKADSTAKGKGKADDPQQEAMAIPPSIKDSGAVEGWSYTTRNSLMFAPDADIPLTQAPRMSKEEEERLGMTAPRSISHANTRLIQPSLSTYNSVPPSPSQSNIAAAITGTPYPGRDPVTPRVGGFSFVDEMPEPTVENLGAAGLKKLMTFGTLAATPVALRSKDSDEPLNKQPVEGPFKIPATPRRETIAHRMARNASKSLSARHGVSVPTLQGAARKRLAGSLTPASVRDSPFGSKSGASPYTRPDGTPGRREDSLTPAARSLLGKTSASTRAGVSSNVFKRDHVTIHGKEAKREAKQREKEVQSRLNKTTWD